MALYRTCGKSFVAGQKNNFGRASADHLVCFRKRNSRQRVATVGPPRTERVCGFSVSPVTVVFEVLLNGNFFILYGRMGGGGGGRKAYQNDNNVFVWAFFAILIFNDNSAARRDTKAATTSLFDAFFTLFNSSWMAFSPIYGSLSR